MQAKDDRHPEVGHAILDLTDRAQSAANPSNICSVNPGRNEELAADKMGSNYTAIDSRKYGV